MGDDRKLGPFDYVKALGDAKKPWPSPTMEGYNAFVVNRALAYHAASILAANKMNLRHNLAPEMQFSYLRANIKPGRRWAKWVTQDKDTKVSLIAEIYNTNHQRARQIMKLLTAEQLSTLLSIYGGPEDDGKQTKPKKPRRGKTDASRKVSDRSRNPKADRDSVNQ